MHEMHIKTLINILTCSKQSLTDVDMVAILNNIIFINITPPLKGCN